MLLMLDMLILNMNGIYEMLQQKLKLKINMLMRL